MAFLRVMQVFVVPASGARLFFGGLFGSALVAFSDHGGAVLGWRTNSCGRVRAEEAWVGFNPYEGASK